MRRMNIFGIATCLTLGFLSINFYSCNDSGVIPPATVSSWIRYYGNASSDVFTSTFVAVDGEIVCGNTGVSGDNDIIALKLDHFGIVQWAKQFSAVGNDQAASVYPLRDGGFIVAGQTQSFGANGFDICLIYLNSDGSIRWSKFYRGSGDDFAASVLQNSDNDFVVTGYTNTGGAGNNDILLMKIDIDGNIRWVKTFGGVFNDFASVIRQTPNASDGGYIITGYTYSFSAIQGDILIMKVSEDGNVTWSKTYGGIDFDKAIDIQISWNGYIVAGATKSFQIGPMEDALVMNIDPMGNFYDTFSVRTFGQFDSDDEAVSLQQTGDQKICVTGTMSNQIFLLKLNFDMSFDWEKLYGSYNSVFLALRNDGTIIVAGNSPQLGSMDGRMLSFQQDGTTCSAATDIIPEAGNPSIDMPPVPVVPLVNSLSLMLNDAPYTNQNYLHSVHDQCPIH
jgi:hypothetical protein